MRDGIRWLRGGCSVLLICALVGCGDDGNHSKDGGAGNTGKGGGSGSGGKAGSGVAGSGVAGSGVAGSGVAGSGVAGSGVAGSGVAGSGGKAGSGVAGSGVAGSGVAGSGVAGSTGGRMDAGTPDVTPPAELTATILDRRQTSVQLDWSSPATDAGSVAGYQIRYAKVAITSANFDDTSVTTAVAFTGTVAAPGGLQDFVVKDLYIQNTYYFAVAATSSGGSQLWMQATATPVIPQFQTTALTGTSGLTNEGAGIALDGSGDANGDGKSDLLIGSSHGAQAYLFLGAAGTLPTTPSVVFSGAAASFGGGVSYIGDIDHDGREDLAIAAPAANEIFIFKGRATWPVTLADTDADYTITADSTYVNASFGTVMSALGDFNGDGVDDFVVGSPNFGGSPSFKGRVTIILGASGFASLTLPSTTRSIIIDADPALATPFFGTRVLGIGQFYSGSGNTLIVSAPGVTSSSITSNNEGHIYAFRGQTGTAGVIAVTAADAVVAGATAGMRIGAVLANLGPMVNTVASVGAGNPNDATAPGAVGSAFLYSGSATTGPFASSKTFYLSNNSLVGAELLGGAVPGKDTALSLIGSATPDLVVGARNGSDFAIVDGSKISALTSPVDARTAAASIVPLPSGFLNLLIGGSTLIPDINGDGYPDFALSNAASNNAGEVVVFW